MLDCQTPSQVSLIQAGNLSSKPVGFFLNGGEGGNNILDVVERQDSNWGMDFLFVCLFLEQVSV